MREVLKRKECMGDIINYPNIPRDDRDGHAEGGYEEGGYAELKKLFLKFKEEAGGDREISDAKLDIPLANEDAIRRLEAESNGIWATVGEIRSELIMSKWKIYEKIRNRKWIVRRIPYKRAKTGYHYLVWVTEPGLMKKIISRRNERQKKQMVELAVPRPELLTLLRMSKIDEETYRKLTQERDKAQFQFQFLVPKKTLHQLYAKSTCCLNNDT